LQAFSPKTAIQGQFFRVRLPVLLCPFHLALGARTERSIYLAEKLKIIPLGGLDEIGKNITVLEYGKDMIVVDCGLGFPDEDL
jgi:hypothetical protein